MRFAPKAGTFQARVFNNPQMGLPPSLFYDLAIPVDLFETGLSYEPNPVMTAFDLDFLQLSVPDWRNLDGRTFALDEHKTDATIVLGGFPNPVTIDKLSFARLYDTLFRVECRLFCDFETRNVRTSDWVELTADLVFIGLYLNFDRSMPAESYHDLVNKLIDTSAYHFGSTPLTNRGRINPAL